MGVRVLRDRDLSQVFFGNAMHLEIALHHLSKEVGEDVDLALALGGMREIAKGLANELAIHFPVGVAHFFVADRNSSIAPSDLQFLDDGEDGLTTRCAGIFDRLYGLAGESRDIRYQAREQPLLVEGDITNGAHGADIDCGGLYL